MSQEKNITFFLPSMDGGGVSKVFLNLMNEYVNNGFKVELILNKKKGLYIPLIDHKIHIVSLNSRVRFCLIKLIRYLHKIKPNVIISGPYFNNIILIIANLVIGNKFKIIATHHNFQDIETKSLGLHGKIAPLLYKMFYPQAFKVVAVSQCLRNHLIYDIGLNSNKVCSINNPVITKKLFVMSEEEVDHTYYAKQSNIPVIISIGRLAKVKNISLIIRAFDMLLKIREAKLIILGDGPEMEKLRDLVKQLRIEDSVDLIGFVINPYKYLNKSNMFVLSSESESFSLVIVEALALGITVVSTDTQGANEVLDGGKYGVITYNNVYKFKDAMLYALNNQYDKNILLERAMEYDTSSIAKEYLSIMK